MMNHIKKTLRWLYVNTFLISTIITFLGWWLLHWSSWWLLTSTVIAIILTVIATYKCFACIRFLTWPHMEAYAERLIKGMNPLMAYPMLIWLKLYGRKIYIKEGDPGFRQAMLDAFEKHGKSTISFLDSLGKKNEAPSDGITIKLPKTDNPV